MKQVGSSYYYHEATLDIKHLPQLNWADFNWTECWRNKSRVEDIENRWLRRPSRESDSRKWDEKKEWEQGKLISHNKAAAWHSRVIEQMIRRTISNTTPAVWTQTYVNTEISLIAQQQWVKKKKESKVKNCTWQPFSFKHSILRPTGWLNAYKSLG